MLRWLWRAALGNRLQMTLNAVLGVASVALSLASVWAVRLSVDIASRVRPGSLPLALTAMGLIILSDFALSIAGVWIRNILGVRAQNRLQRQMLDRVLRSEWQGRGAHHSGDILNRLEGDVGSVTAFLTETLPGALSYALLFAGAFAYLFSIDARLALITVAVVPLCLVLSKMYVGRMRRLNRAVRDSDSRIQSLMQEIVQHQTVIRTLGGDGLVLSRLSASHGELQARVVKRTRFSVLSNFIVNAGFAFTYLLTFGWAAVRLSADTLTFGGMTALLALVARIQGPARSLASLVPKTVGVLTAVERLMELEEIPAETSGEERRLPGPCGLRLRDVTFRYGDGGGDVLRHFSAHFAPGTATAVVGPTGIGKTTLIRLLLALTRPTSGSIVISGADGREEPLTALHRCNLVYVPQGGSLLSGTIADNLRLARPDATESEMREALRLSLADFVLDLPQGLDTPCAEQGGGLSEGQAQRIAIARALLRPGSSVMLFDEATSALDAATERLLLSNILSSHRHTVVFITHRMAVCQYCEQVLSMTND